MGRGFKIFGGFVAVVVVVVVGFAIFVYSNMDAIVKDAVEEYGPRYTGVSVKLDRVELSPENGQGKLSGLTVGNPAGYQTDSAFRLASVSVDIDISTITDETIVIRSIVIDAPDITYEFGDGGSNIDVIGKNVEKAAGPPGTKTETEKEGSGKKMVIESLVISNGNVSVSHPLLKGKKLGSKLPTIRLKDIGKDKKEGATPAEVVDKIMDELEKQLPVAVNSTDINNMIDGLGNAVKDGAKGLEDATKGAEEGLKKLFGK